MAPETIAGKDCSTARMFPASMVTPIEPLPWTTSSCKNCSIFLSPLNVVSDEPQQIRRGEGFLQVHSAALAGTPGFAQLPLSVPPFGQGWFGAGLGWILAGAEDRGAGDLFGDVPDSLWSMYSIRLFLRF